MNDISEKFNIIYKPFLIIAVIFIVAYTFLNWLFFIQIGIWVKEDIVKFWLPFGLPFIPVLIWLRPRIHLLHFKNDKSSFGFQFLACMVIAFPTIIAQEYLITATGKLTSVDNVSQINEYEMTKYYSLKNFYFDKQHFKIRRTATVTGKNNEYFNMLIYVAIPVFKSVEDTSMTENIYWLGRKYSKQIVNGNSDKEKEYRFKEFSEQVQMEFDITDFNKFTYLEVIGNTDDHDEFSKTIEASGKINLRGNTFFEAKDGPFEERSGKKLVWIFGSFGIGSLLYFIFLLFPKFQNKPLENFKKGKVKKNSDLIETFEFLLPREGFYITPIIMDLNLIVFILMVFAGLGIVSFNAEELLNWGANYRPFTTNHQWWRLLTSVFLHGGLMHIIANMVGLLFVGIFLEPLLGKTKYLIIYLTTGIIASIASIWWDEATISVGASGAIFGLYGFFLASILVKTFPPDFGKMFLISTLLFIGFNLISGVFGGIDNAAHIGGLVSGFVIGIIMAQQLKKQNPK